MPAEVPGATGAKSSAEGVVLTSSLVVLVLYAYRKLIEPAAVTPGRTEPALRQIIGAEPKPAPAEKFAVAFGFTFFTLSIAARPAPELASAFAILVAVGYTLTNGASIFADVSRQVRSQTSAGDPRLAGVRGTVSAPGTPALAGVSGSSGSPTRGVTGSSGPRNLPRTIRLEGGETVTINP